MIKLFNISFLDKTDQFSFSIQVTLRKGYGIPDLKLDLSGLYMKAGVKNIGMAATSSQIAQSVICLPYVSIINKNILSLNINMKVRTH